MNRHLHEDTCWCLSETGQENESQLSDGIQALVGRFRVFRVGLGRVLVLVFGGFRLRARWGVGLGWVFKSFGVGFRVERTGFTGRFRVGLRLV